MTIAETALLNAAELERDITGRVGEACVSLHYLQSCASTNSECMKIAKHGAVVIAERQTAGRGRRGNSWHSSSARNIYCSIGIEKKIQAEFLGLISLQVGVCVAEVLHQLGYEDVSLKWPNDVLLGGKKLGGILIETRAIGGDEFFLVVGLGLNTALDDEVINQIDRPAISLQQVNGSAPDRQQLLGHLLSTIYTRVKHLEPADVQTLLQTFAGYDSLYGRAVMVHTRQETLSGRYQGIATTGQIQVLTDAGLQLFSAAEISLREDAHATD